MPSRHYSFWLNEVTYIVIDFKSLDGKVLSFVVRLVHIWNGIDTDVARYDTAHGCPHRDLLTRSGRLRQKDWLGDMSFNGALTHAIDDFRTNHEAYIQSWS